MHEIDPSCHPERAKASRRIFTSRFYCAVGKCKDSSTSLPTVVSLRMTASGRHSGFCFFKSSRRDTTIVNCQFSIVNSRKSASPNHGTAASKTGMTKVGHAGKPPCFSDILYLSLQYLTTSCVSTAFAVKSC